jgi:hypothetical protein
MASYTLNCPYTAYKNTRVEVTAQTDDESVEKVYFAWQGAIQYTETGSIRYGSCTSATYATDEVGKVYVTATFYDVQGYKKDERYCSFDVQ